MDANGNKAAVETGFTNSDFVHVYQEIGPAYFNNVPFSPEIVGSLVGSSGIEAFQHVWSPSFDSIYADAYALNADGSGAIVSANANGRDIDVDIASGTYGKESDFRYSMFKANQNAGVGGGYFQGVLCMEME